METETNPNPAAPIPPQPPVSKTCKCVSESPEDEKFKLEYDLVKNLLIHYSSIRSALTTFLITVGLGALGVYYQTDHAGRWFLPVVALIIFVVAGLVCLDFSKRTELAHLYLTALWKWKWPKKAEGNKENESNPYPVGFFNFEKSVSWGKVIKRMICDGMNWIMGILVFSILALFVAFNWQSLCCSHHCKDKPSKQNSCVVQENQSPQAHEKSPTE